MKWFTTILQDLMDKSPINSEIKANDTAVSYNF